MNPIRILLLSAALLGSSSDAISAIITVASRSDLGGPGVPGNDFVDFATIGPAGTQIPGGFIQSSPGGINVDPDANGFFTITTNNFIQNAGVIDELGGESSILANGGAQNGPLFFSASISFQFDTLVTAAGLDVSLEEFGVADQYSLTLDVDTVSNGNVTTSQFTLFQSFQNNTGVLFNDFAGVRTQSGVAEISRLRVQYIARSAPQRAASGSLEVAQLDLVNPSLAAAVPEPASATSLCALLGLAYSMRQRRRTRN